MDMDFTAGLKGFINQRIVQARDLCEKTSIYNEASKEEARLYDKIKTLLGPGNDRLLLKFNDAKDTIEVTFGDRAYLQGIMDGLRLRDYVRQKIAAEGKNISELYNEHIPCCEVDFCLESLFLE